MAVKWKVWERPWWMKLYDLKAQFTKKVAFCHHSLLAFMLFQMFMCFLDQKGGYLNLFLDIKWKSKGCKRTLHTILQPHTIFFFLIRHFLHSPRLHLFHKNTANTFLYMIFIRDRKAELSVFSVTCSFRNNSNVLICCSVNIKY